MANRNGNKVNATCHRKRVRSVTPSFDHPARSYSHTCTKFANQTWGRFTLRADWLQVHYGDDYCASIGFMYGVNRRVIVEVWLSHPSTRGVEDTLTVKLNYVIAVD